MFLPRVLSLLMLKILGWKNQFIITPVREVFSPKVLPLPKLKRFGCTGGVDIFPRTLIKFTGLLKIIMILIALLCFIVLSQHTISMNRFSDDSFMSGERKNFTAPTKLYEKDFIYYGNGMQQNSVNSKKRIIIIDHVGKTMGSSTMTSLEEGKTVIMEMAAPTEYYKIENKSLSFFDAKTYDTQFTAYNSHSRETSTKIQIVYHLLWNKYHNLLQNKIMLDAEYNTMVSKVKHYKRKNATILFDITKSFCNSLAWWL